MAKISDTTTLPSQENLDIGYIKVGNDPLHVLNWAAADTSTNLNIPQIIERRWLGDTSRGFSSFPSNTLRQVWSRTIQACWLSRHELYTICLPRRGPVRPHEIYRDANADRRWRLFWDRLIMDMLLWVNNIATEGDPRYLRPELAKQRGYQASCSVC